MRVNLSTKGIEIPNHPHSCPLPEYRERENTAAIIMRSFIRSRRELLSGMALATVGVAMGSPQAQDPSALVPTDAMIPTIKELRDHAHQELLARLHTGRLARPDGHLYTVDAAQCMICMARLADADGYGLLRDHCVKIIRDRPDDPFTRGFVPWRYKDGEVADASGTTEAMRVAKGLWLGSKAFAAPADAERSRIVLGGYAAHATVDQGIWLIRNYFSFGSRSFASNSFLVDYDPDFIREVADATGDADLGKLADNCLKAVQSSLAPCGLLYDLIQPELSTLYPELPMPAFSPNDVIGIANSGTTALTAVRLAPDLGRKALQLATLHDGDLRRYYLGRSGRPVNDTPAAICEYCVLIRIAVALNEAADLNRLLNRALQQMHWVANHPELCDVFLHTEMLAAAIAVVEWNERNT
jgi:hypothetical protein